MWSILMLALVAAISFAAFQNSFVVVAQQASLQNDTAVKEALNHQQSVVRWLSACLQAQALPNANASPPASPASGQEDNLPENCRPEAPSPQLRDWRAVDFSKAVVLEDTNLRSRGLSNISPNWKTVWIPPKVYFYANSTGFNLDALRALQQLTGGSLFNGQVVLSDTNAVVLNSNQPPQTVLGETVRLHLSLPSGPPVTTVPAPADTAGLPNEARASGTFVLMSVLPW
jgi:hypothetical protein